MSSLGARVDVWTGHDSSSESADSRYRVAVVSSHPIQYQAPWFRALAQVTDLEVFYCHRQDSAGQAAAGFGVAFDWDVPLLDGYSYTWMENRARTPDVSHFFGCDTPEVSARIRQGGFDACIVCGWYLKSYLQAIFACKAAGVRVLCRGDSQIKTARSGLWRTAKYLPYRWLLNAIDAHLFVGQANRAYLRHYGVPDSRLFFAPHFVDNEFFAARACTAREEHVDLGVRRQLGIPETATVFVFVGKLIEKKRPEDFVRAIATLRTSGDDVWGLIVGSGPLQTELAQLVKQLDAPVRFAGFRNQTELPQYFAASDAIVLPSDGRETWGLVVNEAMACGLPAVVSTSAGCAPDLIDDGQTGYQFTVGDISQLTEMLGRVNRELKNNRPGITSAVLSRISRYSSEAAVRGTLDALRAVVARPHGESRRRPFTRVANRSSHA